MTRRALLGIVMAATLMPRKASAAASASTGRRASADGIEPFVDHAGWIIPAVDRDALLAAGRRRD